MVEIKTIEMGHRDGIGEEAEPIHGVWVTFETPVNDEQKLKHMANNLDSVHWKWLCDATGVVPNDPLLGDKPTPTQLCSIVCLMYEPADWVTRDIDEKRLENVIRNMFNEIQ